MSSTLLRNVAVFGAGGNTIGNHVLHALLANNSFKVSVIARASSKSTYSSANIIRIPDTPDHASLVTAFRGQDAIISAIGWPAKLDEPNLINAAIEAGVKRFLPSEYGLNNDLPAARNLSAVFKAKGEVIDLLRSKESTGLTWTAVATGGWLDWSLDPAASFLSINPAAKTVTYWDNGTHKSSFSTLAWAAEAIVHVLLHPELSANKVFPVRAFEASQKDIVAELEKAQGVAYAVENVDGKTMVADAKKKAAEGDMWAFYTLIAAGFLMDGYGSDLVGEGVVPMGSDQLEGLPKITLQGVVSDVLQRLKAEGK